MRVGCHQQMSTGEIKPSGLHVPGFQHLGWLLPQHIDLVPELYFLFIALMMGQPVKLLPTDSKVRERCRRVLVRLSRTHDINRVVIIIAAARFGQRLEFYVRCPGESHAVVVR